MDSKEDNFDYFNYWGKASKEDNSYHRLPYHSLDVAAVGIEYLTKNKALSDFFSEKLSCAKDDFLAWSAFWLSLHDLGKFSEAFQSQKAVLFAQLHGREPNSEKPYTERHDSLGQWLWSDYLSGQAIEDGWFGNVTEAAVTGLDFWMRAVTGHHGQPPKATALRGNSDDYFSRRDKKSVQDFVSKVRGLLLIDGVSSIPSLHTPENFEHTSQSLSWLFAGVAVLADWLGSNTDYFPYMDKIVPLDKYWPCARERAKKALQATGVIPSPVKTGLTFNDLFPTIADPSPLQQWVIDADIPKCPQIFLLEDVTGAGKTEAALTLAYRLMAAGNASGFFVALPTMATANAMYQRIANVYAKLFKDDANLVLAHGSRNLVDEFAKTIIRESQPENDNEQVDQTATARCSAWLSDHNKRALLAQAGAGTIDQALLGVLHSKHQSLRLLGLFGKVLIVDEVHACDAYMQGVLEILLEFYARSAGSVILLSATLPNHMKTALLNAYARGRSQSSPAVREKAYPLLTQWQASKPNILPELPIKTRAVVARTVQIDYQHDEQRIFDEIKNGVSAGKCVCWIRNTVADALDACAALSEHIKNITLFHARFTLHDRLEQEALIVDRFGPASNSEKRCGQLVIATQVIEQSLDVDFDLLISDLAPIDRLIQRAGRLYRHNRDTQGNRLTDLKSEDQRGTPRLVVYAPEWIAEPTQNWFKEKLPKAAFVYPDHAQLWLTAKALQTGGFSMPGDARSLIEGVFGEASEIPGGLQKINTIVQGQQMADASMAKNNTLTFATGYKRGDVIDWWSEAKTPSRLGEASINVVLARWDGERLVPWVSHRSVWAYSTIRMAERLIANARFPTDAVKSAEYNRTLETLPDKGKWSVLLAFEKNQQGLWLANAWTLASQYKAAEQLVWQYDEKAGLRLLNTNTLTQEDAE